MSSLAGQDVCDFDEEPPIILSLDTIFLRIAQPQGAILELKDLLTGPGVLDNCDREPLFVGFADDVDALAARFSCDCVGERRVVLLARDAAGNEALKTVVLFVDNGEGWCDLEPGDCAAEFFSQPCVDTSVDLACIDQVNITLNADDCRARLGLGQALSGDGDFCLSPSLELLLLVWDEVYPEGAPDAHIDMPGAFTYVVRVVEKSTGATRQEVCWGTVNADDKSPPAVHCPPEVFGLVRSPVSSAEAEAAIEGVHYAFRPGIRGDIDQCADSDDTNEPGEESSDCEDECWRPVEGFHFLSCEDVEKIYQVERSWADERYPYWTGFPGAIDACGEARLWSVSDELLQWECAPEQYASHFGRQVIALILRTFTFTDEAGNSAECVQHIYFFQPEIILPTCEIELNVCDYPDLNLENASDILAPQVIQSAPFYVNGVGERIELDAHACGYTASYVDQVFPGPPGCGLKVLRTWSVLDWRQDCPPHCPQIAVPEECAGAGDWQGKNFVFEQNITAGGFKPPIVSCPALKPEDGGMLTFSTGPFACTAVVNPPPPVVDVACLGWVWTFEIWGNIVDPNTGQSRYGRVAVAANHMAAGVPIGEYDLRYFVRDDCGNTAVRNCRIRVLDRVNPVAICKNELTVSIGGPGTNADGIARVSAQDIDNGSRDNCGDITLHVRRAIAPECLTTYARVALRLPWPNAFSPRKDAASGFTYYTIPTGDTLIVEERGRFFTWWADAVFFTCCDVGDGVTIELRATDRAGNRNVCWLGARVEDKLPPECSAHNQTILCTELDFDPADAAQVAARFGAAKAVLTIKDNCGASVSEVVIWKPGPCGGGVIERIFTVTDDGGLSSQCTQLIFVETVNRYQIRLPGDLESATCGQQPDANLLAETLACDLLAVSKDTARFEASNDECFKLFITYSIINWCEYDGRSVTPTRIARDIDQDGDFNEYTWLDAGLDEPFVRTYLPDENQYWIVKVFAADNRGVRKTLPEQVWVRYPCPNGSFTGYRTYRYNAATRRFQLLCQKDLAAHCANDKDVEPCWTPGFFTYTQIVKVYDATPPSIIAETEKLEFCALGAGGDDCVGRVELILRLEDNCAPLSVTAREVRFLPGGNPALAETEVAGRFTTKRQGERLIVDGQFPLGDHAITLLVADACGNVASRRIDFSVIDCKAPAPVCIQGLAIALMPVDDNGDGIPDGGRNTVWAGDFIARDITDCSGPVRYSLNRLGETPDINRTSLTFSCEDPLFQALPLQVFAWDAAGNRDFCETFLVVEDSRGLCRRPEGKIAGLILTESDIPVRDVAVRLSGREQASYITGTDGFFAFSDLDEGGDYSVVPFLDDNHLNGVSTFDLVLISKHILRVRPFTSPYKLIAADANRSGSVTTLDMILLRRLILRVDERLGANTSWRFVPTAFRFPNPGNPFAQDFPELININNLSGQVNDADFVAVKIGDVNESAAPHGLWAPEDRGFVGVFALRVDDQELTRGVEYHISVQALDMANIAGCQFTLEWDRETLEFVDLRHGAAGAEHFGRFPGEGALTLSWTPAPGQVFSDASTELFTLVLRARREARLSESLRLSSRLTRREAYDHKEESLEVTLDFGRGPAPLEFTLYPNFPNPWRDQTTIAFELPEDQPVELRLVDLQGRLLRVVRMDGQRGYNEIALRQGHLLPPGLLYYTLETPTYAAAGKMLALE
jgi:hypothetical protein